MQVVFDTGSDWLVVESGMCKTCLGNKFYHKGSSTHNFVDKDYNEHLYGSAQLYGYDVKDTVGLTENGYKIKKFEWF